MVKAKIADFGFAREINHDQHLDTIFGTPLYMAPEVMKGDKYSFKADIWSLGITMFEMLVGSHPFTG